jgi:hypothetical protein
VGEVLGRLWGGAIGLVVCLSSKSNATVLADFDSGLDSKMRLVEKFRGDFQGCEFGQGRRGAKTTCFYVCYFVVGDDVVGLGGVGEGEGEGLFHHAVLLELLTVSQAAQEDPFPGTV